MSTATEVPQPSRDVDAEGQVGGVVSQEQSRPVMGRNVAMLTGSQIVTWGMTAIWTLIVPRELGPAGLGLVVSAVSVSSVIGVILAFGSQTYLTRDLVRHPESGPQIVGTAIALRLALLPLVAGVTVGFAYFAHYGAEARIVLLFATATTLFTALAVPPQAAFQALERMQYLAYGNVINKTAQSIVGIILVLLGFGAEGVTADMAIMAGVVFLLNMGWLRRYMRVEFRPRLSALIDMSKKSSAFLVTSVFGMIYLWIDTIMVSIMTNTRVVGWYGAATTLFQTLLFAPTIIATAWLPRLVASSATGREGLMRVARAPVELTLIICIPLAVGTAMFAHVAVVAFYGSAYSHAAPVMVALAVCIPPMSMNVVLAQVAAAQGRQRIWAGLMVTAAFLNPAINLGLITFFQRHDHNGAIGAGWAMVVTEVALDTVGVFMVGRQVLDRGSVKRLALTCAASAGMLGVYDFAAPLGQGIALTAGVVALVALVVRLKILTDDEVRMLVGACRKLRALSSPRPSVGREV